MRRSLVLLKNENILPLKPETKIYLQGFNVEESKKYASVTTSLEVADVIVLKLTTPYGPAGGQYLMEYVFHQGSLEFPDADKEELLKLIQSKPTVTFINLERPAVFPEINPQSKAVIGDFSSQDDIILRFDLRKIQTYRKVAF